MDRRWKDYFEDLLNVEYDRKGDGNEDALGENDYNCNITTEEIEMGVKKMKNGKAAGDDELTADIMTGGEAME